MKLSDLLYELQTAYADYGDMEVRLLHEDNEDPDKFITRLNIATSINWKSIRKDLCFLIYPNDSEFARKDQDDNSLRSSQHKSTSGVPD